MYIQQVILNVSCIFLARISVWNKLLRKNFWLIHLQGFDGISSNAICL